MGDYLKLLINFVIISPSALYYTRPHYYEVFQLL